MDIKDILKRQKEILVELETKQSEFDKSDLRRQLDDLENTKTQLNQTLEEIDKLKAENKRLKNALFEHTFNEKVFLVENAKAKAEIYFKNYEGELNRLTELENSIKKRIDNMTLSLKASRVNIGNNIYQKLDDLAFETNKQITEARRSINKIEGVFSDNEKDEFDKLKSEQLTDDEILKATKKNNFERLIGLNLINKLGILLVVIGVILLSRYTVFKLPDMLKSILMFCAGGAILVAGEFLNRKKANVFSLGISALGVAVLYISLATSFFAFKVLTMYPAILLCVLITATSLILSRRYNSQTILIFTLIGGYMPMFSVDSSNIIFGAMVYFIVLNCLALLVSFSKKWTLASFVGLFLNIAGSIYIMTQMPHKYEIVSIPYLLFAFIVYTLIPILGTYAQKTTFKKSDVVLLGVNTFFSCILMYIAFYQNNFDDYLGLLALGFAVIYVGLGTFIEKKFEGEKKAQGLFYLTGLTFAILMIPFQFGKAWLSLGWLIEGVAITCFGIFTQDKKIRRAGFIIYGLCVGSFILFDINMRIDYQLSLKYLSITLGSAIILGSLAYMKTLSTRFEKAFKYFTIINLWSYAIYVTQTDLYRIINLPSFNKQYLVNAASIVLTISIAFVAPRIKILNDRGTKIISIAIYVISILWLNIINTYSDPIIGLYSIENLTASIIGSIIIAVLGIISVFAVYDLLKTVVMDRKLGVEWYPMILSAYFLVTLTNNLVSQYMLDFSSAVISIIYVILALILITIGFMKHFSYIRRFGLILSLLAVAKLFLIDLSNLDGGFRIATYFALGITLIVISFVYQSFSKRLELSKGDINDA